MDCSISHFCYTNPSTGLAAPLEMWLGPLGPLKTHIIGPVSATLPENASGSTQQVCLLLSERAKADFLPGQPDAASDPSATALTSETIVSIELPSFEEMVRATSQRTTSDPQLDDLLHPRSTTYAPPSHDNTELDRSLAALSDSMNASAGAPFTSSLPPLPSLPDRAGQPLPERPLPVSLPLIIVRPTDGTGYMTGRWVVAEQRVGAEERWGVRIA